jgi:hypothetical protein
MTFLRILLFHSGGAAAQLADVYKTIRTAHEVYKSG